MVDAAALVAGLVFPLADFEVAGLALFFATAGLTVEGFAVLVEADVLAAIFFAVGFVPAFTELVFALVFTAAFLDAATFTAVFFAAAGFARADATFSLVAVDAAELTETFFF